MPSLRADLMRHGTGLLVLAGGVAALVFLVSQGEAGTPERISLFARAVHGILSILSGVLLYLAWRIANRAAYGWTSAMLIGSGLQSFPFILTAFAESENRSHGQMIELPVALWMLAMVTLARRGTTRALHPLQWGIVSAVVTAVLRIWLTTADVLPQSWADGTSPLQRSLVALVTCVIVYQAARTPYSPRFKAAYLVGAAFTGLSAAGSTNGMSSDLAVLAAAAAVAVVSLVVIDGAIRVLIESFDEQQARMEDLVATALRTEAILNRDQELLHEIRSSVGGLTTASTLLSVSDGLNPAQRESLQQALLKELNRVDRTVTGSLTEAGEFRLADVVQPLVEFHRAGGQRIACQPAEGPLTTVRVRHVPDSMAQVVGTLLHNAHRHATGRPVTVTTSVEGARVHLRVSHPGPAVDPSVRHRLFERGARSTSSPGQGLGLSVARRLMQDHGGDLVLAASSDEHTAFELVCDLAGDPAGPPADQDVGDQFGEFDHA